VLIVLAGIIAVITNNPVLIVGLIRPKPKPGR
jgi:hypothetical protein